MLTPCSSDLESEQKPDLESRALFCRTSGVLIKVIQIALAVNSVVVGTPSMYWAVELTLYGPGGPETNPESPPLGSASLARTVLSEYNPIRRCFEVLK
jgi:hypothetical protein